MVFKTVEGNMFQIGNNLNVKYFFLIEVRQNGINKLCGKTLRKLKEWTEDIALKSCKTLQHTNFL